MHWQWTLEGARQSIVLLQNGNGTDVLPIRENQRVLLAGPMFNASDQLLGNYHGAACPDRTGRCLLLLDKSMKVKQSFLGVPVGYKKDTTGISEVVDAATRADVVVLVLG